MFSFNFKIYFLNWFIKNFDFICNSYFKNKNLDQYLYVSEIPNFVSVPDFFINENIRDYLYSDLILHKVIIFLLFILIYSYISLLVVNDKLNLNSLKNLPFGINLYNISIKLFSDWNKISLLFFIIILIFLLISSLITTYYWYWYYSI